MFIRKVTNKKKNQQETIIIKITKDYKMKKKKINERKYKQK